MAKTLSVEILLTAVDRGVKKTFASVGDGLERVNRSSQVYQKTLRGLSGTADNFKSTMLGLAAALGGAGLFAAAARSASSFNSTIEQSQIGIAALVRNFTTLGEAPNGYAQSMQVASQIQKQLQIEGLKTTATYEQLLVALQEGIGPAFKAGFKPDEIVRFTSLMTQAAGAISLPMDQLGQELRAILDGTIDKNARVAKALGITNAKVKEMAASGKLFEYLQGQLAAFAEAGDAMGKSFTGAVSNVKDAVQMALGTAMQNSFAQTTAFMLRLKDAIVTIDDEAGTFTFNEKITAAFDEVDKALSDLLGKFSKEELAAMLASFVQAMGAVATAVLRFVGAISQVGVWLGPLAPLVAGTVTWFALLAGSFKLVIGAGLFLYQRVLGLAAAFTTLTGMSVVAWLKSVRVALSNTSLAAAGLKGVIGGIAGVFLAWEVGKWVGGWLLQFGIVQKAGITLAHGLEMAWLQVRKAWAWATGGDTAAVERQIAIARLVYAEMIAEINQGAKKSAQIQKDAYEEIAVVAKDSGEDQKAAQAAALKEMKKQYKSYADEVKRLQDQIAGREQSLYDQLRGLARSGMSGMNAWQDLKKQAEEYEAKAKQAAAAGDFKGAAEAADKAKDFYSQLNTEIKEGEQVLLSQPEALKIAMAGVERTGQLGIDALKKQQTAAHDAMTAMAKENPLEDLSGAMDKTEQEWLKNWERMRAGAEKQVAAVEQKIVALTRDRQVTVYINEVVKKASGGLIGAAASAYKLARGGKLPGYGGGDRISALLEAGEFVIRKEAVARFGSGFFQQLNSLRLQAPPRLNLPEIPRFALGGMVGAPGPAAAAESINVNLTLPGGKTPVRVTADRANAGELLRQLARMQRLAS